MAGKKFGLVIAVKVPASYHALTAEEQAVPGQVMAQLAPKYAGKVDILRRLWTSAFTAEVSDVFIVEADDMMEVHNFTQDLTRLEAEGGDPNRFGVEVRRVGRSQPETRADGCSARDLAEEGRDR